MTREHQARVTVSKTSWQCALRNRYRTFESIFSDAAVVSVLAPRPYQRTLCCVEGERKGLYHYIALCECNPKRKQTSQAIIQGAANNGWATVYPEPVGQPLPPIHGTRENI